jgi:hypothetical protein
MKLLAAKVAPMKTRQWQACNPNIEAVTTIL